MSTSGVDSEVEAPERGASSRRRLIGAAAAGLFLAWLAVAASVAVEALPPNPLVRPWHGATAARVLLPQGWSVFWGDPQEERPVVFVLDETTWRSAIPLPHAASANAFGLNRTSRAQEGELRALLVHLPESDFKPCVPAVPECLSELTTATVLENNAGKPTICGETGFVLRRPVPWSWTSDVTRMPARGVRVRVRC